MEIKPSVAVLLTTYKPFPFIHEQIESLRLQENVDLTVFWGDDGSSSIEIREVEALLTGMRYYKFCFDHVGASQNFMNLLKSADGFQYYAFCDQDDVWDFDKLTKQIQLLGSSNALIKGVHSHPLILYRNKIRRQDIKCLSDDPILLALSNCSKGCTLMINSSARDAVLEFLPTEVTWHDWWISLVVASRGELIKSDYPLMKYRLHRENQIGEPNFITKILRIIIRPKGLVVRQIKLLMGSQGATMSKELIEKYNRLLISFSDGGIQHLLLLMRIGRIKKSLLEDLVFKLRCLFFTP